MRLLLIISRLVIGITFILSGILKAIDPVGFGLKIDEYLKAFGLEAMDIVSLPAGVLLCAMEFVIGVCLIQGVKMKFFSKIALLFISFFTLLTLYSAVFDPVKDCGCFGEALHLTNWETFFKNIILFFCALLIYIKRMSFVPNSNKRWENICITSYIAFILAINCHALMFLPPVDFGAYKPGTDLIEALQNQPEMEYETTFIYSKDDQEQEFTLNNLPDSTWTFVEANTKLISESSSIGNITDFVLKNSYGEYVTEQVLSSPSPIFFVSVLYPDKLSQYNITQLAQLLDSTASYGADFYLLSGNAPDSTSSATDTGSPEVLYTDYKTALLFNRSNGGVVYVNDGVIIEKWGEYNYPTREFGKLLNQDCEIIIANTASRERIFMELSLLVVAIMIIIGRLFNKKM